MVKKQQASADKAYEIQTNVMQQQVRAEEVTIHQVEKEHEVKVQDAEILRRDRELTATVLKQAEFERKRIETLAEAEKMRLVMEAEGRAAAIRAQGEAEAEIIFKKGEAEAKAMNVKAEAYQEFNQAAIVDKLITGMPEIVRALAAPLANVDKITIVSTGNGTSAGMHKITGDITEMAAQIPALFETLSGHAAARAVREGPADRREAAEAGRSRPRAQQSSVARSKIMALLERVATLVRANLNDLVDKAEDPEKMIKQVILDMQNQLLQVKTQVAISIADQHVLEKKLKENDESEKQWQRRAEMAVDKKDDAAGARRAGARDDPPVDDRELPAAGGRPEDAGGEPEVRAAQAAAEARWRRSRRATC